MDDWLVDAGDEKIKGDERRRRSGRGVGGGSEADGVWIREEG